MKAVGSLFGERVRIKYWDQEAAYYFDAEILKVPGSINQHVVISKPSGAVVL